MEIKSTYIGINKDGIQGIWCGFLPSDVTLIEEKEILYPSEGCILQHIESEVFMDAVELLVGDSIENYREIEKETSDDGIINNK